MQGGLAGLLSYDLNQSLESIASRQVDEFQLPTVAIGCYDVVIAWDHEQHRAWIISSGIPEQDPQLRSAQAHARADFFQELLQSDLAVAVSQTQSERTAIAAIQNHVVGGPPGLTSNLTREQYIVAAQKCIEYIYAGDVFQINLAQRLLYPAQRDSVELFQRLRRCNPAPFSGYFDLSQMGQTRCANRECFTRTFFFRSKRYRRNASDQRHTAPDGNPPGRHSCPRQTRQQRQRSRRKHDDCRFDAERFVALL